MYVDSYNDVNFLPVPERKARLQVIASRGLADDDVVVAASLSDMLDLIGVSDVNTSRKHKKTGRQYVIHTRYVMQLCLSNHGSPLSPFLNLNQIKDKKRVIEAGLVLRTPYLDG